MLANCIDTLIVYDLRTKCSWGHRKR
jgi:hypothetical protein